VGHISCKKYRGDEMESIITALITGGLALLGVIITNASSNKSVENKIATAQAVTDAKLESLTEEVRKHNNFATRVPVLEEKISHLDDEIKELKNV
jgi:hypothetical protein